MTGWRLGYLVASKEIIDECLKLSQFSVTSIAPFSQRAGLVALTNPESINYAVWMRSEYTKRRQLLLSKSAGTWLEEVLNPPQGAFYALIDCSRFQYSSEQLAMKLVDGWSVALTPGIAFGSSTDRFLRLCFAASEATLIAAINALVDIGTKLK
jgi:aminotransferase